MTWKDQLGAVVADALAAGATAEAILEAVLDAHRRARVAALASQGLSDAEVGREVGLTGPAVRRVRGSAGIAPGGKAGAGRPRTGWEEVVDRGLAEGRTVAELAAELGVKPKTIANRLSRRRRARRPPVAGG